MATQAIQVSNDQLELVRKTVAKDATPQELQLFLYDCSRRGVHPLDKLIHFTKRQGRYTPITSIDFMRIRAAESGEYAGSDDPVFEDGNNCPKTAKVKVYRMVQGQRCEFSATARWAEYSPANLSDSAAFMWRKMPYTMLGKCAEALALRKAFPGQLQGLYAKEELDQADSQPRMAPEDAKAFVAEQMARVKQEPKQLPEPTYQTSTIPQQLYEETPEGDQARFCLTKVEKATGRNGEYRKVFWNGGQASAFEADMFEYFDKLKPGDVVTVGIKRNPKNKYINITRLIETERQQSDPLEIQDTDIPPVEAYEEALPF